MRAGFFKMTLEKWGDVEIDVGVARYRDDSPMMQIGSADGPVAIMSVRVPGTFLEDGEFLIKNWSENAQIFEELVAKGVLVPTGRTVPTGFVEAVVCRLGDIQGFIEYNVR